MKTFKFNQNLFLKFLISNCEIALLILISLAQQRNAARGLLLMLA
jgi:hypothetical protein